MSGYILDVTTSQRVMHSVLDVATVTHRMRVATGRIVLLPPAIRSSVPDAGYHKHAPLPMSPQDVLLAAFCMHPAQRFHK